MYGRRLPLINWFRFDDRPLSLKGTRTVLLTSKIYLITFEEQEILLWTTILRAFPSIRNRNKQTRSQLLGTHVVRRSMQAFPYQENSIIKEVHSVSNI